MLEQSFVGQGQELIILHLQEVTAFGKLWNVWKLWHEKVQQVELVFGLEHVVEQIFSLRIFLLEFNVTRFLVSWALTKQII